MVESFISDCRNSEEVNSLVLDKVLNYLSSKISDLDIVLSVNFLNLPSFILIIKVALNFKSLTLRLSYTYNLITRNQASVWIVRSSMRINSLRLTNSS